MNNLKKIVIAVALAAPVAALAAGGTSYAPSTTASSSNSSFYVQALGGVTTYKLGLNLPGMKTVGFGMGLNAGYNFFKGLGVELGGLYAFKQDELSQWNIHAALRVAAQVSDAAQVYAKGGMAYVRESGEGEHQSRVVPFFGLGGAYNFMKTGSGDLGLALEWDHTASYLKASTDNLNDGTATGVAGSDSFLLGLNWSMSL